MATFVACHMLTVLLQIIYKLILALRSDCIDKQVYLQLHCPHMANLLSGIGVILFVICNEKRITVYSIAPDQDKHYLL